MLRRFRKWRMVGIAILTTAHVTTELCARSLQSQDLWELARVGEPRLAPDGKKACYTVQRWSIDRNTATTHLWLVDVASTQTRELTTGDVAGDSAPAWSPDGASIAFVSKRPGDSVPALYVVRVGDQVIRRIVAPPMGASLPQWSPDGKSLVFVTRVIDAVAPRVTDATLRIVADELARRRASPLHVRVTEGGFYRFDGDWLPEGVAHRLVKVDLATGHLLDLMPGYDRLFSPRGATAFSIAPDGASVAVSVNRADPREAEENDDVILVPMDGSGKWRVLTADNPHGDSLPCFSPDGRFVLFGRRTQAIYAGENTRLFRHELATGKNSPLLTEQELDLSFSSWRYSADGREIVCVANRDGRTPVFACDANGRHLHALTDSGTAEYPQIGPDGSLVFLHDSFDQSQEICGLAPGQSSVRMLTQTNAKRLAAIEFGSVESRHFKANDGATVQLWVVFPPHFDATKRYPLLQLLHGGPHSMAGDSFSFLWNAHAFAATGAVVALVNRRGSTGFGERFAREVVGNWRDRPLADILESTDYLLATYPSIDSRRMAACGVSYGGYLVNALAGQTDRFACLVTHGGISDLHAQYGSDLAAQLTPTFGGFPWQEQERFRANNPVSQASNFRTPMLILQGGRDTRVPETNAFALYGMLQAMKIPSRLIIFPDETHWVQTPQDSLFWYREVFAWLARWLGSPAP